MARRIGFLLVCCASVLAASGDEGSSPPVSSYAPAAVLVSEADDLVESLGKSLGKDLDFELVESVLQKDGYTLAIVATALAQHDEPHRLSESAGALAGAASELAEATSHDEARTALAAVQAAAKGEVGEATAAEFDPVAMGPLMKQVAFMTNRLRRDTKGTRLARRAEQTSRYAAVMAVIAAAIVDDDSLVEDEDDEAIWRRLCGDMRDAAGALGGAIRGEDVKEAEGAVKRLATSCDACHEAFRVEQ